MLESDYWTAREFRACLEGLQGDAQDCGSYLGEELDGPLAVPVEGAGEGRVDGSTRASGQTEQQTKVLPSDHSLLSEYFQSCDSKRISCPGSVLLQETNLLPRFSGQAEAEYHGNPPNIMVIRQISW